MTPLPEPRAESGATRHLTRLGSECEFVIRTYRSGKRVVEIPVQILEKRPPSINLLKRVPRVLKNLAQLTWALRADN